jgi:hypothetical protein
MRPGLIHFSFFSFSVFILFQTAIVKVFRPSVCNFRPCGEILSVIMPSCLPLILLGSVSLTHQSEVPFPKSTDLLRERRPTSDIFDRTSIIDTQPARNSTSIPSYRRFDKYENRMSSLSHDYLYSGNLQHESAIPQARRVASTPLPLKLDFRNSRQHDPPSPVNEKGKGKKRCSYTKPYDASEYVRVGIFDDDHVGPFRSNHAAKALSSSVASPSGSTSTPRHVSADPTLAELPRLHVLEEDLQARSPQSSIESSAASSPRIRPSEINDGALTPDSTDPSRSPPRLAKRVSFSSAADRSASAAYSTSQEVNSTPGRAPWGGLSLFGKPYVVARPPASRQISLPAVRGQAAGRSILKRTTSCSEDLTLSNAPEASPTGVPIHEKIHMDSLRRSSKRTSKRDSAVDFLNDRNNIDSFDEIDLSQEASGNAPTANKNAMSPTSTLSSEERAVRHWSMVGSNWIRRSGLFTQAVNVQ